MFTAFVLSGAIAGVAGVLWLSHYGSVDSTAGTGYEFEVIAAVVVGGVAIFGGSGSVFGAALGALLLNTIDNALVVVKVSSSWTWRSRARCSCGAITFDRLVSLRLAPALRTRRSTPCLSRARRRAPVATAAALLVAGRARSSSC